MNLPEGTSSYHKAADQFLHTYFEANPDTTIFFIYRFINLLAREAKTLAKDIGLKDMEYQDSIVATWFMYTGITDLTAEMPPDRFDLLNTFFEQVTYPPEHRELVLEAIISVTEKKHAHSKIQKVVSDAVYSQFIFPNFLENIILLKDEVTRLTGKSQGEQHFLKHYHQLFVRSRYYTQYAKERYHFPRERNFQLLEKRLLKLEETERLRSNGKIYNASVLSNKETEDVFKLAFRNYNHLVAVADSKAALLINVNSIIISIMLVFVISKVERNTALLPPTILLLCISMITIVLSILASRPRKNITTAESGSGSSQKFFFGSFDMIDPKFKHISWDTYQHELNELFTGHRENVYTEVYKESYNVRRVLAKKFFYLSAAYWVFILGLLIAITAFVISIQFQKTAL
jgi:hypothetical protein